jgi:hypothetical protein
VHKFDSGQSAPCRLNGLKPQHRTCNPLHRAMTLLNDMISNDNFCLIRRCQDQLRWSRRLYCFRPRKHACLLDEAHHGEGSHETPLATTSAIPANGGWSAGMESVIRIALATCRTRLRCGIFAARTYQARPIATKIIGSWRRSSATASGCTSAFA